MSRLKILMADDQQTEIEEARKALKEMAHEVAAVATFDEALRLAQNETFDIAVVDLGWFTDPSFKDKTKEEDAASAGWRILELIKEKNPDTVRILYSARTDEPKITQVATEQGIHCIQKNFSKEGRLRLADTVKVIARHLSIESDLKSRIRDLESDLEKAAAHIKELESDRGKTDSEERGFRRILLATTLAPTLSFILFITTWLLTQQLIVAVIAFIGGAFLSLAILRAIGAFSLADLKYFGTLWKSLLRLSNTK